MSDAAIAESIEKFNLVKLILIGEPLAGFRAGVGPIQGICGIPGGSTGKAGSLICALYPECRLCAWPGS